MLYNDIMCKSCMTKMMHSKIFSFSLNCNKCKNILDTLIMSHYPKHEKTAYSHSDSTIALLFGPHGDIYQNKIASVAIFRKAGKHSSPNSVLTSHYH